MIYEELDREEYHGYTIILLQDYDTINELPIEGKSFYRIELDGIGLDVITDNIRSAKSIIRTRISRGPALMEELYKIDREYTRVVVKREKLIEKMSRLGL